MERTKPQVSCLSGFCRRGSRTAKNDAVNYLSVQQTAAANPTLRVHRCTPKPWSQQLDPAASNASPRSVVGDEHPSARRWILRVPCRGRARTGGGRRSNSWARPVSEAPNRSRSAAGVQRVGVEAQDIATPNAGRVVAGVSHRRGCGFSSSQGRQSRQQDSQIPRAERAGVRAGRVELPSDRHLSAGEPHRTRRAAVRQGGNATAKSRSCGDEPIVRHPQRCGSRRRRRLAALNTTHRSPQSPRKRRHRRRRKISGVTVAESHRRGARPCLAARPATICWG